VEIRLLGPIEVVANDGHPVALGGPTQAALLALLALEAPDLIDSDRIAGELWAEKSPRDPDASLQVAVSRLRKAMGGDLIETGRSGYRLLVPIERLDVERFRRHTVRGRRSLAAGEPYRAGEGLRQALAQWRGDALADLKRYEFALRAAAILEEERLAVVETLMDAELAAGRHEHVIGDLAGLVEAHPLRERLRGLQMLALYRSGRQAEALRAFGRLRELLADELGVDPSHELVELEERILMQDPALDVADTAVDQDAPTEGGELVAFSKGQVIIEEGAPSDTVYWIEEGTVQVYRASSNGEEVLAELGPGRYFGELAGLLGIRRTASVRALTAVTVSAHTTDGFRRRLAVGAG
jgi:DNA-binding SARP family transcriptional activator